jgi:hypothetical protein
MTSNLVDFVVVGLLVATCAYCFALNRRLKSVREGQSSLESAIAAFDAAAAMTQTSLHRIETDGAAAGRELAAAIRRAEALAGDLSVMVAAGDRVAGRLESGLVSAKIVEAAR